MHRCVSDIKYNRDGGWHVGAGREQIVCASIKHTHVLQLLLPKLCQTQFFLWLRNEILMGLKSMAQFTLTSLVQLLCLRYIFRSFLFCQ